MYALKKIDVISLAKFSAMVSLIFSLIPALFMLLFSFLLSGKMGGAYSWFSGFFVVMIFPVMAGIAGFIYGAILAFVYNLFAKYNFKIKFDLEKTEKSPETEASGRA